MITKTKERPIIFNGPMVRAILAGRKTQTRINILTKSTAGFSGERRWVQETWADLADQQSTCGWIGNYQSCIIFRADQIEYYGESDDIGCVYEGDIKWHAPMFMPRSASRITLEITRLRMQRIQDITEEDALAEGIELTFIPGLYPGQVLPRFTAPGVTMTNINGERDEHAPAHRSAQEAYACLWDSINAKRGFGWDANPLVWVIEFKRIVP